MSLGTGSFAFSLRPRPEFGSLLRRRLRLWLSDIGASDSETYDVLLAVSEAVTNAIQHAREPRRDRVDVEAGLVGDLVTVLVRDYGAWDNERQRDNGGRGLPLMRALMDAVAIESVADGTSVKLRRHLALN